MKYTFQDLYQYGADGNRSAIGFIVLVVCVVGWWQLFKKADRPGILSIIPIANVAVLSKITFGSYWYVLLLIVPIVNIFYGIALNYQVMRRFGCGRILCILGAFFPVLVLIPAFGDYTYLGPKR
ncbi:MAG: DUF5684 domain-containing protein [Peptoniphilus sp.]|nr:DUF5684 domain-containing protein [Peptoniphilus sp.]MDD7363794.1 DUF5684 domain-containing protein [Bacillota bacterium]MDY6044635.1 DUF5684 domain-containing protein [Peptoniphilus sp.]